MKKFIVPMLLMASLTSFAGNEKGNGGGAFICKTIATATAGEVILSAQSQDLWETARRYEVISSNLEADVLAFDVLEKLKSIGATRFLSEVKRELKKVMGMRSIEDVKLVPVGDSRHYVEMASCTAGTPEFTAAAIYQDQANDLVFSKRVYEKFDNISKAALNVHEAVYKVLRSEYKDVDSVRTRKIVGYLFSDMDETAIIEDIPSDSFNPDSSKSYKEKFVELVDLYNRGAKASVGEITGFEGSACYRVENVTKTLFTYNQVERLSLQNSLATKTDRKNIVSVYGVLNFKERQEDIILGGTNQFYAFPYSFYSIEHKLESAIVLPYSSSNPMTPTKKISLRKTTNGDFVAIVSPENDVCLKGNGLLGLGKCKKYADVNLIKNEPHREVNYIYYCSKK